jgi:hypothetical protein
MDVALLDMMRSGRSKNWAETMINLEARKLINTTNHVSSVHLSNGMTQVKFVQEIWLSSSLRLADVQNQKKNA